MSDARSRNPSGEEGQFTQINVSAALARMAGDSGLLAELARLFIEESQALMSALRRAVQERDAGAIERQAHSLKGSAANFEAKQVYSLALALERKGRERDLTGLDDLLAALERSAGLLTRELELLSQTG